MSDFDVTVVGGGLAGSEASWQLAQRGFRVRLVEMRPTRSTPAHHTGYLAELVCTNSFRSNSLENAVGLVKEEMRRLGSLIIAVADRHAIPGGAALAIDREAFSRDVTRCIEQHPNVTIVREEQTEIPDGPAIIATGPLTSPALHQALLEFTGEGELAYYDAAAPIVTAESIDWDKVFWGSRYGKGDPESYANCPLTEEEYQAFWEALRTAERHPREPFEEEKYFEACLPIEVMADRGRDTMRFGPMRPVGLIDPRTGKRPYAVVQLRRENAAGTLFNIVGFQTSLKWGEQKRVFRMIPALAHAEFERYGVIHRNTFLKSPKILRPTLQSKRRDDLFFAGQIVGTEGYVEAAMDGLVAGINMARLLRGEAPLVFPPTTAIGGLLRYVTSADPETFQPMHVAFGLMDPLENPPKDKTQRKLALSRRALEGLAAFQAEHGVQPVPGPAPEGAADAPGVSVRT
ncbi:MAG: methylenetetrahydrofolate--tRNA-(uracil(54)-C(5))-methyltransferase (FADH(2)-oxidizing) TrmFO [Clostridia bacterium]|nr:methylenetetrahydrofolate--tRNA-(uracil(54)-C(5))-methyltransferase (FADH(2)-oxidizing) TrmFO [Clostridia bacterium]